MVVVVAWYLGRHVCGSVGCGGGEGAVLDGTGGPLGGGLVGVGFPPLLPLK